MLSHVAYYRQDRAVAMVAMVLLRRFYALASLVTNDVMVCAWLRMADCCTTHRTSSDCATASSSTHTRCNAQRIRVHCSKRVLCTLAIHRSVCATLHVLELHILANLTRIARGAAVCDGSGCDGRHEQRHPQAPARHCQVYVGGSGTKGEAAGVFAARAEVPSHSDSQQGFICALLTHYMSTFLVTCPCASIVRPFNS